MSRGAKYAILFFLTLSIVFVFAGQTFAGVVFELEIKDYAPARSFPMGGMGPGGMGANRPGSIQVQAIPSTSEPRILKTQVWAQGRDLKVATTDDKGQPASIMIFHGEKQEMVVLNPADQTYMVMDSDALESMAKRMNEMQSQMATQMQEALKNVPAEQRAAIEQMMKQRMPNQQAQATPEPAADIKKMDEKDTKNGFPCVKYVATRANKTTHEYWVTEWKNIKGSQEVTKVFEDMADFYQKMMGTLSKNRSMGGALQANQGNPFEHIKAFQGIPVMTKEFGQDNAVANESFLRSAKQQALAPDTFEPPAGYKRQPMFGVP
jgi:hypothetical protein